MVRALGEDYIGKNILPFTQLNRLIRPEEIADAICFMLANSAVSGELWADAGWHAGVGYRRIAALFDHSQGRLKPGGRMYVMVSSDSDLDLLGRLIHRAGFRARLAYERSFYIESMILYELRI